MHSNQPKLVGGGKDEVLVAIMNSPRDFAIARDRHWYRIPVRSANKWLTRRWPPGWIAFYLTKVFGGEAFCVNSYANVIGVRERLRSELLPDEPQHQNSGERYYQLLLGPIQALPQPIPSRRRRRIVFIPTTWQKFLRATEINELYDESPLEDLLWEQIKRIHLTAERQEFITANGSDYALDFAFYCVNGKLDVETDGDVWHSSKERIRQDNRRDNDVETAGWKLLRFDSYHLREKAVEYCIPAIVENVRRLGGLAEDRIIPRDIRPDSSSPSQMSLFDDQE